MIILTSLSANTPNRVHPRKNPIVQEYILPDFSSNRPGYIRKGPNAVTRESSPIIEDQSGSAGSKPLADEPVLYMSNERFTVPEVLFHPSDVGTYLNILLIPRDVEFDWRFDLNWGCGLTGLDQAGLAPTIAASIQ